MPPNRAPRAAPSVSVTRISPPPIPQVPASACDYAARPGSCRKPPGRYKLKVGRSGHSAFTEPRMQLWGEKDIILCRIKVSSPSVRPKDFDWLLSLEDGPGRADEPLGPAPPGRWPPPMPGSDSSCANKYEAPDQRGSVLNEGLRITRLGSERGQAMRRAERERKCLDARPSPARTTASGLLTPAS
jgi:hypothetical protein